MQTNNESTAEKKPKYRLIVEKDDHPVNPRKNKNLGTMVCWLDDCNLGDKKMYDNPEEYLMQLICDSVSIKRLMEYLQNVFTDNNNRIVYDEVENQWCWQCKNRGQWSNLYVFTKRDLRKKEFRKKLILEQFFYDYGSICITCTKYTSEHDDGDYFDDIFESGQLGWIYVSYKDIRREYGEITPEVTEKVEKRLVNEVNKYNSYLHGDCYKYVIEKCGKIVANDSGYIGILRGVISEMKTKAAKEYQHLFDHIRNKRLEYIEEV